MPGRAPTDCRRPLGRAFFSRSSMVVVASVAAVILPDLAADFAARRCRRMNVRVGCSVAQRADEFFKRSVGVDSAGGNLLCGQGYDIGARDCSFHRRRRSWTSRSGAAAQEHDYPTIHTALTEMNVSLCHRATFYIFIGEFEGNLGVLNARFEISTRLRGDDGNLLLARQSGSHCIIPIVS